METPGEITDVRKDAAVMAIPKSEATDRAGALLTADPKDALPMAARKEGIPRREDTEVRTGDPMDVLKAGRVTDHRKDVAMSSLQDARMEQDRREAGISALPEDALSTGTGGRPAIRKADADSPLRTGNLQEGISALQAGNRQAHRDLQGLRDRQAKQDSLARGQHVRQPRGRIRKNSTRQTSRTSISC